MNVKELEARTGLPRASIRFYEKEGLLRPARKSNGYRDYSEEDALTLEKIAFLRRLELPLDTIRRVQSGEIPLSLAARQQWETLRARQTETAHAAEICGQLYQDGSSYTTLQPERYAMQLPPAARQAIPAEKPGYNPAAGHYWRRYFARTLDHGICGLIWVLFSTYVLRLPFTTWGWSVYGAIAVLFLVAALEPVMLTLWGWTPGKWLMGLRLTDGEDKPRYSDALMRTLGVLFAGLGLGLPWISLICGFFAWRRADKGQESRWDEDSVLDYTYRGDGQRQGLRDAVTVAVIGLTLAVSVVIAIHGPPAAYDGRLTPEQYAEACNEMLQTYDNGAYSGFRMTASGEIVYNENGVLPEAAAFTPYAFPAESLHQQIETADGYVTSVTMRATPGIRMMEQITPDMAWLKLISIQVLTGASQYKVQRDVGNKLILGSQGTVTLDGWEIYQAMENPDGTPCKGNDFQYLSASVICVTDGLPADTVPPSLVFRMRYIGE